MKKVVSRLLAFALTASLLLTGCGGGTATEEKENAETSTQKTEQSEEGKKEEAKEEKKGEQIKDLVIPKVASKEISGFNILYTQKGEDFEGLSSLMDGLLEIDISGKLIPAIAEEWGTEDEGHTWTFKVRQGVKWVNVNGEEVAECNAQDFATGLEWILNFHKNDSTNTSMPLEMIEGANEYYEYTKTLTKDEAYALNAEEGSKFREMVGLETPDDYTLVYHCLAAKPYFDSLATYNCLYPAPKALVDQMGPEAYRAINNETMWYNGCYTMTEYLQGNQKVYTKNPMYWDQDCTLFDTVTFKMTESGDISYQLYENGEVDYVGLGEARINTIAKDPSNPLYNYMVPDAPQKRSFQFHFNYNKMKDDGTPDDNWNKAIANDSFRKVWWYGLDLSNYFKRFNAINPMICENNYYTMKGLCYTSDGKDYVELVRDAMGMKKEDGKTPARLDKAKAEQYKKQAMEELKALGVTFPVSLDHYISGSSQAALDSANVLKQCFTNSLGDDYIVLNIKTYIKSNRQEVFIPHLHSVALNGWGADYGDPQNYLGQEVYGNDNAYYSANYSYINEITEETPENKALLDTYKEYTKMVEAADAIVDDMDARYAAYAKAEAYLLDHALVIPQNYSVGWVLSKVDNDSKAFAMYGCANDKMKNWDTKADGYTSEEKGVAEQIKAFTEAQA